MAFPETFKCFCDSDFWAPSPRWGNERAELCLDVRNWCLRNSHSLHPCPQQEPAAHSAQAHTCRAERTPEMLPPPRRCAPTCRNPLGAQKLITATIFRTLPMCQVICKAFCVHLLTYSSQQPSEEDITKPILQWRKRRFRTLKQITRVIELLGCGSSRFKSRFV